ncbi:MAG TPA: hypothetical protein VGJ94_07585 [Syntrophorhabdaceae bacterium]
MKKYLLLLGLSFSLQGFGYYCLVHRVEPFCYFFYVTSWWSFIILADAVLAAKKGRLSVLDRRLPLTVFVSCGYWCLFEILNLRLQNWHYIALPEERAIRYAAYLLSYGTVVPAIYLTDELLRHIFPGELRIRPRSIPSRYPAYALTTGFLCLLLLLIFPSVAFPLAWVFLALLIDGYNYLRGYRSFAGDLEAGTLAACLRGATAGLFCGVIWEAWNYRALSKWIYTVPFVEGPKIFEMPLAGYIGFLAFGIETIALLNLLEGISRDRIPLYVPATLALAVSLVVFPFIDRYTVLSFVPAIYR